MVRGGVFVTLGGNEEGRRKKSGRERRGEEEVWDVWRRREGEDVGCGVCDICGVCVCGGRGSDNQTSFLHLLSM